MFFLSVAFFVKELSHLQRILSLNKFVFIFASLGIILAIIVTFFLVKGLTIKEKIVLYLYNTLLLASFFLSIASYVNRNISELEPIDMLLVKEVVPEFNEMYGNIETVKSDIMATHWRVYFDYHNNSLSRALKVLPCSKEIISSKKCYLNVQKGSLGFELLDNME